MYIGEGWCDSESSGVPYIPSRYGGAHHSDTSRCPLMICIFLIHAIVNKQFCTILYIFNHFHSATLSHNYVLAKFINVRNTESDSRCLPTGESEAWL